MTTEDATPKKTRSVRPQTLYKNVETAVQNLGLSNSSTIGELLDELKTEWFRTST